MEDLYPYLKLKDNLFPVRCRDALTHFDFNIYIDVGGEDKKIGELQVIRLNTDASARSGYSMFETFDSDGCDAASYYDDIFTLEGAIRPELCSETVSEDLWDNLQILHRIEIDKEYRGHGLTEKITKAYLETFGSDADVVFVKAFPLQYDNSDTPNAKYGIEGSQEECFERLCRYYQRIGFKRVGTTNKFLFTANEFFNYEMDE